MLKLFLKQTARLSIILVLLFGLGVQVKPAAAADPVEIIVNLIGDDPDLYEWDNVCDTTEGGAFDCTLRAAIQHANYLQSTNGTRIIFEIVHGDHPVLGVSIQISQALPSLQVPGTIIQGPNITGKPVVLNGQGGAYPGLEILADDCEIKDLTISNFSGFGAYGIEVRGTELDPITGTLIIGNTIGDFNLFTLDPDPNYGGIHLLYAGSPVIGGSTTAERNIISGNTGYGILIDTGGSNVIKGNYIGLTEDGTAAMPNHTGILIDGSNGNTIGGSAPSERNIISGNTSVGINIQGDNNVVTGNYIGTDISGTLAIPNASSGIRAANQVVAYSGNKIGGPNPGEGNLISGNAEYGIFVSNSGGILIQGNTIGMDASKTSPLPNNLGISIYDSINSHIGAAISGAGNEISGNTRQGIYLTQNDPYVMTTFIRGNHITHNGMDGITVENANQTTIGGSDPLYRNTISNNGDNGIELYSATAEIKGNYIFNNAGLGIDVFTNTTQRGVTPNDVSEADNVQNFPGLTSVSYPNAGKVLLGGQMTTTPGESLNLYFYGNDSCDPSGYGEGQVYLGFIQKTADSSGRISFSDELLNPEAKTNFTATAWGPTHGNSEFSPCRSAGIFPPLIFDVYLPLIMK